MCATLPKARCVLLSVSPTIVAPASLLRGPTISLRARLRNLESQCASWSPDTSETQLIPHSRTQDNVERQETWLTVWVHEAKGLPRAAAPGVRAELWLDGALLARTAPRAGPGQLFWAERFHFEALPPARRLSLRLRGAGPGGAAVGRVALELDEVSIPRAPAAGLERWFPVLGAPASAALRARIRVRRLRVLPSERYKELAEFLTFHYARLCEALESALSAQAKEELAAAMVRVLRATGRAQVRSPDYTDRWPQSRQIALSDVLGRKGLYSVHLGRAP